MELIDGKKLSLIKYDELKKKINKEITLAIISVGNDSASKVYINNKIKAANMLGIDLRLHNYEETDNETIVNLINDLNNDDSVNGIIVQLPLPSYLDKDLILNSISYKKDVDCLTDVNIGKLHSGKPYIIPCTPKGIIDLIDYYNIDVGGKNVLVIGRSNLVGKPIASLLTNRNATVTIAHSKSNNLKKLCLNNDIIISCVGKAKLITEDMINDNSIIIDVGINRIDNKLCGDADFANVCNKCSYITPVPGGVGPMTVYELYSNLYELSNK